MAKNPWVQSAACEAEVGDDELADAVARATPARPDLAPQSASVTPPRSGDCFPRRVADTPAGPATMWWMGVHGGAGESTLEQLLEGSRAAGHAWPIAEDDAVPPPRVMLVARTTARGLQAAQLAAREWASGTVPVDLVGLVLIADAPGRLPKPLRDLAQVVVGGVPRSWRLPWVEPWRLGESVSETTAPKTVTQLLDELRASYVDEAPASPPNS